MPSISCARYFLTIVDDILVVGPFLDVINQIIHSLNHEFTIKDLGVATFFIDQELAQSPQGIYINQRK